MTAFVVTPVEAFLLSQGKAHLAGTHGLGCSVLEPVIDVSAYYCCPELSLFNSVQKGEYSPRKLKWFLKGLFLLHIFYEPKLALITKGDRLQRLITEELGGNSKYE